MKLQQLRTFVAIADEGSFVAAARALGVAQPAVSKQVAHLEREMGGALFVREPAGVRLTEAGEALLREARTILELNERAITRTRAAAHGGLAELHLGQAEMLRSHEARVAAVAVVFGDREPRVSIVSHRLSSAEQWRALDARRLHLGVGYGRPEGVAGLECARLADASATRVLLPAAHPLAERPRVRFRDLAELPLLFFPREVNPPLYDQVLASLAECGLSPTLRPWIHSQTAREAAVRAGHGWMLAVDGAPETPAGVEAREVEDPPITVTLSLWWRAGETEPAVLSFVDIALAGA